ncbi:glycosyltransferase [Bifidobacterium avesanii]|uniref:Glycosyltransferase n=1 Tax=Bifidobacterium avesanii TaxID=1798157 RepID=A0A7K3TET7_9BIFI|nr:glycosyltransferase [Bifidobacterium avesanii]KAB8295594.1 glycosyl transferase family 2 [Bifidobacterium avesanii]NEG77598.1 glycosyltransferase [Bifidobacterium avesanii]
MNTATVTAVVVSYNRPQLLRECLDGIAAQNRPADRVIVIDNASTDDAAAVAKSHPIGADVVELSRNYGGAGGFCAGMALAVAGAPQPDFLWVMDDDTVPTPTALNELLKATQACRDANGTLPAVLGSKTLWTDGREHPMSRPRPRTWLFRGERDLPGCGGAFQARSMSFVSCLINVQAMLALKALPRAAFFLWNDDFEFTTRLLRRGIGYYVPSSEVVHKTKVFGSSDADPGERFRFEVRNKIWMMRACRGDFSGREYAEFLLKTVRRWALTFARSGDRALLRRAGMRGLREALGAKPSPNAELLADEPAVAQAVRAIED